MDFLGIFIRLRRGGNLNLRIFNGEKIGKSNRKFLKCQIGIKDIYKLD
jgi:hypothetical protein